MKTDEELFEEWWKTIEFPTCDRSFMAGLNIGRSQLSSTQKKLDESIGVIRFYGNSVNWHRPDYGNFAEEFLQKLETNSNEGRENE